MASSSKNTGRTKKKKSSSECLYAGRKKTSSKRRSPKKKNQKKHRSRWRIIGIPFVMLMLIGVGYCLGTCREESRTVLPKPHKEHRVKDRKREVHQKVQHLSRHVVHPKHKKGEVHEVLSQKYPKVRLAYRGEKPRLAIIIDDVHTRAQLDAVTSLPFPVTPSIFPPYSQSPDTHKLATYAVHYMIHLPMESGNAKYDAQSKTLKTGFTKAQIRARVHELRRLFPRAHYINNHTGSRFTENSHAMQILYEAMKREGFTFIDSVTTGRSRVKEIAHRYGDAYVARDIFIDNRQDIGYIRSQLKKAVSLAKKNGYAIAIGHPHAMTFEALSRAKPLLKEVEVVYIDAIFRRY
jgi:polysaccharide deacetylase 2 family uncharacterized protein YibQ